MNLAPDFRINRLTPDDVFALVKGEEFPLRCQDQPAAMVEKVLRFGGVVGSVIHCHAELERGMETARSLIARHERDGIPFASGTVIIADTLTGGKGRFRRRWHAPPGGIWLTLVLVDTLLPEVGRLYPLAAGVACCEILRQYGLPASIRWVNDVLVHGDKIAGVLVENESGRLSGEQYVLIGIGINVNNTRFPAELRQTAASVAGLLGGPRPLAPLTAGLLAKLTWNIGLLHYDEHRRLAGQDSHCLIDAWRRLSDTVGHRVRYGFNVVDQPQYTARVLAVEDDGSLVLRLDEDGTVVREQSGELRYLD